MQRAAIERLRTVATWRAHQRRAHGSEKTGCICDEQAGRFRKGQRVLGCNKARCFMCHGDKLMGVPKAAWLRQQAREQDGEGSKDGDDHAGNSAG